LPATRRDFWSDKIAENRSRDARVLTALRAAGWRVLTIWECALRGPGKQQISVVARRGRTFILGHEAELEMAGESRDHLAQSRFISRSDASLSHSNSSIPTA
jgi:DNA mismatch endonuclease (patch repair protein)